MEPITTMVLLIGFVLSTIVAIKSNWEHILISINGKKFAFLGDKGTGKTTSINFLTKNILSVGYNQTRYVKKTDERRFYMGDNENEIYISLKKSSDVGGDTAFYKEWEILFKESNWIFYIVQSKLLINGDRDTKKRIEQDLDLIQGWRNNYDSKSKKKLVIICNFCDQVDNLKTDIPRQIGSDEIRKLFPLINEKGSGISVFLGSLLTEESAEKLFELVFRHISR
ncbi:MAG: hypothetical protein QNJ55_02065 [Xenococcus sp. MO_188.B8]|nr:hypothetical protein [Xenococcus sp. MO_188.B8]